MRPQRTAPRLVRLAQRLLDQRDDVTLATDIALDRDGAGRSVALLDELDGALGGLFVDVGADDARAFGGEDERCLEADAAACKA